MQLYLQIQKPNIYFFICSNRDRLGFYAEIQIIFWYSVGDAILNGKTLWVSSVSTRDIQYVQNVLLTCMLVCFQRRDIVCVGTSFNF